MTPRHTSTPSQARILAGRLIVDPLQLPELGWVRVEGGTIVEVGYGDPPQDASPQPIGGRDRVITPAFIDAHIHLPQVQSVGCDGLPLLQWLDQVIFPAEEWWGRGMAIAGARTAVRRMLREGTAAFAGYLTSHAQPARQVTEFLAARTPMRFVAGRVAMDRNASDDLTKEDRSRVAMTPTPSPVSAPLDDTGEHRVSANPRFAVSCSDELLAEVGWYVGKHPDTIVQTHLSESNPECELIRTLFLDDESYTAVYDRFGLLTPNSLLAHCVHLTPAEWELIAQRQSIVVHCPAANLFLQSGLFNLDAARAHGVRLALGSDVAGGPDIAMPRVARAMIETAKIRKLTGAERAYIPAPDEVWSLITRGNAEVLGWKDSGRIEKGARADLLVLHPPVGWLDEHLLGRLIYGWTSRLIEHRFVRGTLVDPATITTETSRA